MRTFFYRALFPSYMNRPPREWKHTGVPTMYIKISKAESNDETHSVAVQVLQRHLSLKKYNQKESKIKIYIWDEFPRGCVTVDLWVITPRERAGRYQPQTRNYCLCPSRPSALKKKTVRFAETLVSTHNSTRLHNPEVHQHTTSQTASTECSLARGSQLTQKFSSWIEPEDWPLCSQDAATVHYSETAESSSPSHLFLTHSRFVFQVVPKFSWAD